MAAAYVIVEGVTVDEAEARGLVVVEYAVSGATRVPVFGYYLADDAPGVAPKAKPAKAG